MTSDTLTSLKEFQHEIKQKISNQKTLAEQSKFLLVLEQRTALAQVLDRAKEID